jgi:hypothetical protein
VVETSKIKFFKIRLINLFPSTFHVIPLS